MDTANETFKLEHSTPYREPDDTRYRKFVRAKVKSFIEGLSFEPREALMLLRALEAASDASFMLIPFRDSVQGKGFKDIDTVNRAYAAEVSVHKLIKAGVGQDPAEAQATLSEKQSALLNAAIGLFIHAGAIMGYVAENLSGAEPDLEGLLSNFGDVEFYREAGLDALGFSSEENTDANIRKHSALAANV